MPKQERLSSRKDIEELYRKGTSLSAFPIKVIYLPNQLDYSRIIVSVPKRSFKRAVKRNLLKRKIREAYRLNKQILSTEEKKGYDLFFIYISREIAEYSVIYAKISEILEKITVGVPDHAG